MGDTFHVIGNIHCTIHVLYRASREPGNRLKVILHAVVCRKEKVKFFSPEASFSKTSDSEIYAFTVHVHSTVCRLYASRSTFLFRFVLLTINNLDWQITIGIVGKYEVRMHIAHKKRNLCFAILLYLCSYILCSHQLLEILSCSRMQS